MKDNPEWTSCFNLCVLVFGQKSLCSWIHMCVITFFFLQALNGIIKRLVWAVPFSPLLSCRLIPIFKSAQFGQLYTFHFILKRGVAYVVTLRF